MCVIGVETSFETCVTGVETITEIGIIDLETDIENIRYLSRCYCIGNCYFNRFNNTVLSVSVGLMLIG